MFPVCVDSFLKQRYGYFSQFEENQVVQVTDDFSSLLQEEDKSFDLTLLSNADLRKRISLFRKYMRDILNECKEAKRRGGVVGYSGDLLFETDYEDHIEFVKLENEKRLKDEEKDQEQMNDLLRMLDENSDEIFAKKYICDALTDLRLRKKLHDRDTAKLIAISSKLNSLKTEIACDCSLQILQFFGDYCVNAKNSELKKNYLLYIETNKYFPQFIHAMIAFKNVTCLCAMTEYHFLMSYIQNCKVEKQNEKNEQVEKEDRKELFEEEKLLCDIMICLFENNLYAFRMLVTKPKILYELVNLPFMKKKNRISHILVDIDSFDHPSKSKVKIVTLQQLYNFVIPICETLTKYFKKLMDGKESTNSELHQRIEICFSDFENTPTLTFLRGFLKRVLYLSKSQQNQKDKSETSITLHPQSTKDFQMLEHVDIMSCYSILLSLVKKFHLINNKTKEEVEKERYSDACMELLQLSPALFEYQ